VSRQPSSKATAVRRERSNRILIATIALVALAGTGSILAANINIPTANIALGTDNLAFCATGTNVEYGLRIATNNTTVVDSVRVTGIPTTCDGEFIALRLFNSSGTLIDEIVWNLDARIGDTTITAIADETTTSTSNGSSSGASLSYPTSQTDPEGLATAIAASAITRIELEHLAASRAAQE